jgi:hypothetical protein
MTSILNTIAQYVTELSRLEACKEDKKNVIFYDKIGKPFVKNDLDVEYITFLKPRHLYNAVRNDCTLYNLAKTVKWADALDVVRGVKKSKTREKAATIIQKVVKVRLEADDCPICFDKLSIKNKKCVVIKCGHSFHYGCLQNQTKCPVCRRTFDLAKSHKCRTYKAYIPNMLQK